MCAWLGCTVLGGEGVVGRLPRSPEPGQPLLSKTRRIPKAVGRGRWQPARLRPCADVRKEPLIQLPQPAPTADT